MKKKIRKIIDIMMLGLIITAVGISAGKHFYNNSHVRFADEAMGMVICETVRGNHVTPENVTRKELKKILRLEAGFSGYYKTLKDIRYCTNLKYLSINWRLGDCDPAFAINQGEVDRELSKDEIEEVQEELGIILPRLSNLKILWLSNMGGCNWTSVEFLKNCDQLEEVYLYNSDANDYSALQTCTSLKHIYLKGTQIFYAEELKGMKNIESIDVYGTPLAQNSEEVNKLQEMYPDASIYYER